ncbi:MAG: toprim domain-containing protein [Alphaproteobacteria bacterium]|jgi:putative DNA primase/helicase|nr:toprim domain-containing protein [Alphaproteobacteria bacterium]
MHSAHAFANTLRAASFALKGEPVADGRIYRCHVKDDKPGTRNGAYILFPDGRCGLYGTWKDGQWHKWVAGGAEPNPAQRAQMRQEMARARAAREREERARHLAAQAEAQRLWQSAPPLFCHPYLRRKGVKSYGLRRAPDGRAVMPLYDANGALWNLERVADGGTKRTLPGGRVTGLYFPIPGAAGAESGPLLITEGYTTAASLRASTGHCVAVARNAGNLLPVALALRAKYPGRPITICGDDDRHLVQNIGRAKATEAAAAIGAALCFPPAPYNDFNDWAQALAKDGRAPA